MNDETLDDSSAQVVIEQPKSKNHRWDVRHACLFCLDVFTNLTKHLMNRHAKEELVSTIMKLPLKLKKPERWVDGAEEIGRP